VTRLRLRALRFLPAFAWHTRRTLAQVQAAPGFLGGALLPDRRWTFWTMTVWTRREDMRAYVASGAHRAAMTHLPVWCDEASVVHWDLETPVMPGWAEAEQRMRRDGRPSRVRHPSETHLSLQFAPARLSHSSPIRSSAAVR